jgi:hypothetical protein
MAAPVGPEIGTSSEAFTSMTSDRGTSIDVANDANGILGLEVSSSIIAGETNRLVTITNNVGQPVDISVSLDQDPGTLSNGQRTLQSGKTLEVLIDVGCDTRTQVVTFTVDGSAGNRFSGSASRSASIDTSSCRKTEIPPKVLTHVDPDTQEIRTIGTSGLTTSFTSDKEGITGIGGKKADFDADGDLDVAFVTGNSELKFVDAAGNTKKLLSSGPVPLEKRLGVGDVDDDGDVDVLFINENEIIEAIDTSGSRQTVIGDGKRLKSSALAGTADFNGDGDRDIVYIPKSNFVEFVDDGAVTRVKTKVETANGIGTPADVDGDGQVELPYTNDNGNISLIDANGADGTIGLGTQIAADGIPLATVQDRNGDDDPDIAYQNDDDQTIYITDTGGATGFQEQVSNSNGNPVTTVNEQGIGVA